MTAYQISTRVFSGLSKYLADREDWLESLFDWPAGSILLWQTSTLPFYFFGDLTWSGAQILKILKWRYPRLAA